MRNLTVIFMVMACIILTSICYAVTETVLMQDVPADTSYFGYSVDADGSQAIVGAHWDSSFGIYTGAAYIFEFDGTQWNMKQKIGPSEPAAMMWFGNAVAIDGQYAAIGAMGDADSKGAVYIFQNNGTEWTEIKKLEATDGEANDFFGFALDLNGMEVVVGAYWDSPKGEHSGSAYQFCGGCGGWQQEGRFIPEDGHSGAEFGSAVAINEHHIVIGSPFYSLPTKGFDGKLYYYFKDEDQKAWDLVQEIYSPYPGGRFGHSIAIAGIDGPPFSDMRLIVGAPDYQNSVGAVHVYENTKGTWDFIDEIVSDIAPGVDTDFGWSVDLDKFGTAIVGMPRYEDTAAEQGAAAVYVLSGGEYSYHDLLVSGNAEESDNLGWSVSTAQERFFAGAYLKSDSTVTQCGAVSVFDDLAIPTAVPTVTPTPDPSTPTPTATPNITTGVDIEMPLNMYKMGDQCFCTATVSYGETAAAVNVPIFIILDVYGTMFFAPDFSEFSYYELDLNPGDVEVIEVLPDFTWPEVGETANNIYWYAGMTNPEMSELLGEMDMFEFGWQ